MNQPSIQISFNHPFHRHLFWHKKLEWYTKKKVGIVGVSVRWKFTVKAPYKSKYQNKTRITKKWTICMYLCTDRGGEMRQWVIHFSNSLTRRPASGCCRSAAGSSDRLRSKIWRMENRDWGRFFTMSSLGYVHKCVPRGSPIGVYLL
jgi:hypothetical protein